MREIAEVICAALGDDFESERESLVARTRALAEAPPALPAALAAAAPSSRLTDLRIWVDCTAAAHPRRPAAGDRGAARARATRSRSRPATTARRRGCSSGSGSRYESFGSPRRRLDRWQGDGARLAQRARSPAGRGRSASTSAIAHGSVDLAVVGTLLRIPTAQMQDYEYAGLQRKLAWRAARRVIVPDAIPLDRLEAAGAPSGQARPLPGPEGGLLPGRLRPRPGGARRARARPRSASAPAAERRPRPRRRPPAAGDLRLPRRQPALRARARPARRRSRGRDGADPAHRGARRAAARARGTSRR